MSRVCPNTLQACECDTYAPCAALTSPSRARPSDRSALIDDLVRECDRAVAQALRNTASGERTDAGGTYETCFRLVLAKHLDTTPEARAGDCDWKCVRTEVTPLSPVVLLDGQPPHDPPTYKVVRYWQATIGKRTEEITTKATP